MSIYILKTSHTVIKIGNSNVHYKLQFCTSHNAHSKSQMLHSVEALSPFCLSNGPFVGFLVGTSSPARAPQDPPTPTTQASTPTSATFHF